MSSAPTIHLGDINLSSLKLIKETCQWIGDQDHSRWIFRSHTSGNYFKIWNTTYVRRDHILRGLESGFYDESTVPAFQTLITANGVCRGYVLRKCSPARTRDPDFDALILEKTAQTGFFAVQYSRYHAMQYGNRLSLIDLEAVHPLDELPFLADRYHCFFDDAEYERFVVDLYHNTFPQRPVPRQLTPAKTKSTAMQKARSLFQSFTRRLRIRWGAIFNHIKKIEY